MQRTGIEYADLAWNPIKGLCPVGCWYCYARRYYTRFKKDEHLRLDEKELTAPLRRHKPARVFACSTVDLFAPQIPREWQDKIFRTIEACSRLTFLVLTKFPSTARNYFDRMGVPPNVWFGTTVTGATLTKEYNASDLMRIPAKVRFISYEPLLGEPRLELRANWWVIGRLTQRRPPIEDYEYWLQKTVAAMLVAAANHRIPVFVKKNLRPLLAAWSEDFPDYKKT